MAGRRSRFCLAAAVLVLLSCDDPPAPAPAGPSATQQQTLPSWLAPDDPQSPARWLADRRPCAGDGREALLAERLDAATRVYRESRRMIANRLAQVEDFLAQRGEMRCPESILADLMLDSGQRTGHDVSFGAVLQAYIVLRQDGIGHDSAIAQIRRSSDGQRSLSPERQWTPARQEQTDVNMP
ncbi:hypothetical protein [Oleisolibacter albus]|uniref:hypothetical protein n=1 Tax=Oleisolibacter albus TaxID=2171757 RepID=UPI000DF311F5|nr:hypothetical protein [Oleisolibacter albus]